MALSCRSDIRNLSNSQKECGTCKTCFPTSAIHYPFNRDLANSQMLVEEIKRFVKDSTGLDCIDTDEYKKPDLKVVNVNGDLVARIEAKYLEGKAFMKVATMLSDKLYPKETLVVDEPKLLSYFACKEDDRLKYGRDIPIFVVWKYDRPCADVGGICIFQEVDILKTIYQQKGGSRKFTRRTGQGDFVSGVRMGVIDKFHYSISECNPIEELPTAILSFTGR